MDSLTNKVLELLQGFDLWCAVACGLVAYFLWWRFGQTSWRRKRIVKYRTWVAISAATVCLCELLIAHVPFFESLRFWKRDYVIAIVTRFDENTSEIALRADNPTDQTVEITDIACVITPDEGAKFKVFPDAIRQQLEWSDRIVVFLPVNAGLEIYSNKFSLSVFLLGKTAVLDVKPGGITTNLVPLLDTFRNVCDQFIDNTPFHLAIHFGLIDGSGNPHEVNLPLGDYRRTATGSWLQGSIFPVKARLLPSDVLRGKSSMEGTVTNVKSNTLRLSDWPFYKDLEKYPRRRVKNFGPNAEFVIVSYDVGQDVKELVPFLYVENRIAIAVNLKSTLEPWDVVSLAEAVVSIRSADSRKLRLDIMGVLSNGWNTGKLGKEPNVTYALPLDKGQWEMPVRNISGTNAWRRLESLRVEYTVAKKAWFKLFHPDDLRPSKFNLASVPTNIVDASWTPVDDVQSFLKQRRGILLIAETKIDWSTLTSTNVTSGRIDVKPIDSDKSEPSEGKK
jgi:hypothetical protein